MRKSRGDEDEAGVVVVYVTLTFWTNLFCLKAQSLSQRMYSRNSCQCVSPPPFKKDRTGSDFDKIFLKDRKSQSVSGFRLQRNSTVY